MDLTEAKAGLSSGDVNKIRESLQYLKENGGSDVIDQLKTAKSGLPVYETELIEEIDRVIAEISKRAAPAEKVLEPAAPQVVVEAKVAPGAETQQAAPAQSESAPVDAVAGETKAERPSGNGDAQGSASGQREDSNGSSDYPQNEYLEKVKDIWEKGKEAAIKNATLIKLKSQLSTIKSDKILQIKHLGQKTYDTFRENLPSIDYVAENIKKIKEFEEQIEKKRAEERDIDAYKAEGGFWNVVKASISKLAGYTKLKLDISILQNNLESKISSFGQVLYDKIVECEPILKPHQEIYELIQIIRDLDRQREEKENEIAELSQQ